MSVLANTVFLGCNYNDKKIKRQFDALKTKIEKDTPLSCVIIDKRQGKSARDLWKDIRDHIEESAATIFDVTGFRPNVVLELGYALSIKSEDRIFITFRKRKSHGQTPKWLLTDISHLQRHDYISIATLDKHIREQLQGTPYLKGYQEFIKDCGTTNAADKYKESVLKILLAVRDEGPKSDQQIRGLMAGSACRFSQMTRLLKKHGLIVRARGKGKFTIPQEK
jgi:hypothetical protein